MSPGKELSLRGRPPEKLVVVGLYRYSRNPMYIAVALVLLGWAISFGSMGLLAYTLIVMVAFHLRVVLGEEPWLARTTVVSGSTTPVTFRGGSGERHAQRHP